MKNVPYDLWEAVIGLEIHVQLNTKTKLFSPAPNKFGDEPNSNITEICTGQPGALPLLNKEAIKKAVLFGLAINAEISKFSKFDRKSYFYPDSPRNFQITQFHDPIVKNGIVITEVDGKRKEFQVKQAQLEDDAGMLKHFASFAGIDFNRAGVPLIEIVSEPCMHSAKEAVSYAMTVKAIMEYINASDCNMEEGQLRIDANISVRPRNETTLRNRTEIKNMNSFYNMEMAIEEEIKRQIKIYTLHPNEDLNTLVPQSTCRWDPVKREIQLMRKKESADDYRYFPEPDLLPIFLTQEYIDEIKNELPELPHDRFKRYVKDLQLSEYNASILTNEKKLADYFEEGLKICKNAKNLCNWITVEFFGRLKEINQTLFSLGIPSQNIAKLVNLIENSTITGKIAKCVADDMIKNPQKDPGIIVKENPNYQPLSNSSEIEPIVDKVLLENPESIADYKAGKDKAFAYLVGQVMKLTKGKASPQIVNELLRKKIK